MSEYQAMIDTSTTISERAAVYMRRMFDMAAGDEKLDIGLRHAAQIALNSHVTGVASYGELFLCNELNGRYLDDNAAAIEISDALTACRQAA